MYVLVPAQKKQNRNIEKIVSFAENGAEKKKRQQTKCEYHITLFIFIPKSII